MMKHWLMKAEPNSRIEKGKDVKFSVDDFESVKTTPWEGVRNHEAKKLMQSMNVGDQVLFYHSNCKNPGVAGFAEVSKEAYPDHTAWDPEHPYYDPKSDKDAPRWFMVDVTFKSRAEHFVPLTLFKRIANLSTDEAPDDIAYIGPEGVRAIKEMALIKRGRLSVQPVEEDAWRAVQQLAEKGGWEEALDAPTTPTNNRKTNKGAKATKNEINGPDDVSKRDEEKAKAGRRRKPKSKTNEDDNVERAVEGEKTDGTKTRSRKRKVEAVAYDEQPEEGTRKAPSLIRSTRSRR